MSDKPQPVRRSTTDADPESRRGRHPGEEGEPLAAPEVPEDEHIVPNRHSASAEAAWMRWRETHDDDD
jgi:hypothetical protein